MTIKEERFMEAVEAHGEMEAAKELDVSQPTIAHAIRDLEEEHNTILVKPHSRPLELTKEGMILYNALKRIQQIKEMCNENIGKTSKGHISIGITYPADRTIAFRVLDKYLVDYHKSKVDLKECSRFDFCDRLLDGSIDFAVSPSEIYVEGIELIATIVNTEWGLVIPSGMPLARKERVSGRDLRDMPFILHSDPYFNSVIENHLRIDLRRTEASYDSSANLLAIMQNGFGMGFITSNEKEFFERNFMTFIPFFPQLKTTFYVYSREYSSLHVFAQKLYEKINKTTIDYENILY